MDEVPGVELAAQDFVHFGEVLLSVRADLVDRACAHVFINGLIVGATVDAHGFDKEEVFLASPTAYFFTCFISLSDFPAITSTSSGVIAKKIDFFRISVWGKFIFGFI